MNAKVWLNAYPPGVPAEADVYRYRSLTAMIKASCERQSKQAAFINLGHTLTYADLDRESRRFAAYLQKGLKLAKGDKLAIMLPNVLQYPVVFFGALRAGLVVVNVNPLYTPRELDQQLADAGVRTAVVLENFAHKLSGLIGPTRLRHVITTAVADLLPAPRRLLVNFAVKHLKRMVPPWKIAGAVALRGALEEGEHYRLDEIDLGPEDIALLQYTGGTTGRPKGALLSHGNVVANVMQIAAWTGQTLREGVETVVTPLPLYHIFSLTANLLTFVAIGGCNLLVTDPRDIPGFIALLRGVVGGGDSIQASVAKRWKQVTGTAIIEGYGLTEASPVVCANPLDVPEFTGMIGVPLPSTDVSMRDDRGSEVPVGEVGEICVKGPQVMRGYWNRPGENAKALADGWLHTGDMGIMRADGFIKFSERKDDVISVSGFKVFPSEVEEVAMMLPGVREAAAAAIADDRSGQAVKLFVVRRDPELTSEQVLAHCRKNLTGYKVPKVVEFRDSLPKGAIGKIIRRALY
ncbi:MAG: AMP-binding protein [Betaproteobacteria bacterium]|nr:AMP-binding protein [Betaproteobacteria bacterium]